MQRYDYVNNDNTPCPFIFNLELPARPPQQVSRTLRLVSGNKTNYFLHIHPSNGNATKLGHKFSRDLNYLFMELLYY
jgi:hypothetical protein